MCLKINAVFNIWLITITVTASNYRNSNTVIINGETYDLGINSETYNIQTSERPTAFYAKPHNESSAALESHASDMFVDLILAGAKKLIKDRGLDPADLPDAIAKFSKVIIGIKIWGDAKVRKIQ